jgi:hypothetical protein
MTDRATLLDLAHRCEQAAGPDRELDVAIAFACGIVTSRDGDCFYGHKYYSVMVLNYDYYDTEYRAPELPPYTASLDAAVTLVPEGWTWGRFHSGTVECMTLNGPGNSILLERGKGISAALALCAAALRARAAANE